MRRYYIDNIRTIIILLLFPYHAFMIWNNFGSKFYVWGGNNNILSSLIVLVSPWFMPVLFTMAGMSARYSLEKRDTKTFIKERVNKLLIPLISGLVLLVPFQTLYARKFFADYNGGIADNFKYFFTHFTDLNGYDGAFTFGHLWFLLYLFVITLITMPIIKKMPFRKSDSKLNNINALWIILLFAPISVLYHIGNFGGQSLGKYTALYFLGYYLFTDEFAEKLLRYKWVILPLFAVSQTALALLYFKYGYYGDLLMNFVSWLGILSCIIMGKLFLDRENKIGNYFRKASFPIYILHQTILVIIGYYSLTMTSNFILQISTVIFGSFALTVLLYETVSKIPVLKKLIGVK